MADPQHLDVLYFTSSFSDNGTNTPPQARAICRLAERLAPYLPVSDTKTDPNWPRNIQAIDGRRRERGHRDRPFSSILVLWLALPTQTRHPTGSVASLGMQIEELWRGTLEGSFQLVELEK